MKFAVVKSSEMFANNRWDAEFHIINQEYAARAKELESKIDAKEVFDLLSDSSTIPIEVLRLITPLSRSKRSQQGFTRDQLLDAVKEYPHLALAIIKDQGSSIIEQKQQELEESAEKIRLTQARIQTLDKKMGEILHDAPEQNETSSPKITNLQEIPEEVKAFLEGNAFVAGVVYCDGNTLHIPPETSKTAYVADCWKIPKEDWTGTGMIDEWVNNGEVPVPVRREDLGEPIGFVESLADHTQNYGKGWRQR